MRSDMVYLLGDCYLLSTCCKQQYTGKLPGGQWIIYAAVVYYCIVGVESPSDNFLESTDRHYLFGRDCSQDEVYVPYQQRNTQTLEANDHIQLCLSRRNAYNFVFWDYSNVASFLGRYF